MSDRHGNATEKHLKLDVSVQQLPVTAPNAVYFSEHATLFFFMLSSHGATAVVGSEGCLGFVPRILLLAQQPG